MIPSMTASSSTGGRLRPHRVRPLLTLLALGCMSPAADPADAQIPVLVSSEWVAEHVGDPDVVLVHVGMSHRGMPETFIPGSRFLDYHLITAREQEGLSTEIPPVDGIVAALREIGISNDHHLVVYGSPGHLPARVYVTLDYLGHGDRTSVLDGGLEVWTAEGRETETAATDAASRGTFEARLNPDVLVDADWILERLDDPGTTLIDARPEVEYTGERTPETLRPGHIPGAYNLYWQELLVSEERPVLQALENVRARFEEAGAEPGGTVVNYCYIGMRASYTYLISKHLGYDARFYDGSWNDWGARDDTPAVEGTGRR